MKFLGVILTMTLAFSAYANKLEKDMKTINKNFKAIAKQLDKADKKDDTLKRLDTILESAKSAQMETPDTISKLPTDKQPEALTKYKDYLQKFMDKTTELKTAINENNSDQIKSLLKDIDQLKKDGHKEFKKKKKN